MCARAGFKGVECGLQSANMTALKAVNRMCDLERFTAGVTRMDRRGIVVKTDLITDKYYRHYERQTREAGTV